MFKPTNAQKLRQIRFRLSIRTEHLPKVPEPHIKPVHSKPHPNSRYMKLRPSTEITVQTFPKHTKSSTNKANFPI